MENYVYPLIVCEEEGKILFFNGAAQAAFGQDELLGRPLPEAWMQADDVEIETADAGRTPFRLIWEEIMWDGNVAWYLVAVPAVAESVPTADGPPSRAALEESQEMAALQQELQQSREMAAAETEALRAKLARSEEMARDSDELRQRLVAAELMAAEADELREQLEQSTGAAEEVSELRARLEQAESAAGELEALRARLEESEQLAAEAEELRTRLHQSVEMAAVETEKRQVAEGEREKLEAKLRDLHQRSLSKLEAARKTLENERLERNQLSERLAKLKAETDTLRHQLEEKATEADEARHQSGEHFEELKAELIKKAELLTSRESELETKNRDLDEADRELAAKQADYEEKCRELAQAEERAERYRKEYEDIDREMAASQEQSAVLSAKLQSVEARMERYQRLMDREPNEFARGNDSEQELERLRDRVEELEVELAATTAAVRSHESGESTGLGDLEAECRKLRKDLDDRESRVRELEQALAQDGGGAATDGGALAGELADAKAVISELRFHRELEYQEAQSALRTLQERNAQIQVNGQVTTEAVGVPVAEVEEIQQQLEATKEALKIQQELASEMPALNQRIRLLEDDLKDALVAASAASAAGAATAANEEQDEAAQLRIQELEHELQRAQQEASPEELQLARRRISELEAALASQPAAPASGEMAERNQALEAELSKTREQLSELNNELRRTLEGDRETKKLAYADQLTGLPNLNLTGQYLQVCFERSGRGEGSLALILIDLDHFRRVNDALGQKAGDELLKQVGARLQRSVTQKDTAIARRGEDEFMVVAFMENSRVDGEALLARIRGIAHNLLNELAKPFDILNQKVQVTASLGVALYPGPAQDRTELLEQSEHAMYKAKESGRARVSFYTEDVHNNRERRRYLESELRQAAAQGQFGLVYQPIYELATSKIVGVEALLRWSHPTRGLLEPSEFLEVAEDTGVIVQIGDQVVQEALQVAKQKYMKRRFLTINLSFRQLIDSGFSARFMKYLQVAGVPPHEIIVEISEKDTRVDPDRVKNTLAHLAHWGVGIALDDFGTGTSELSSLIDMSLRVLKIDTSIIAKIPDDQAACKLCQAITQMSSTLGIPVLAEGVETKEQLGHVANYGCQYAQGLILGEPMNVSQLIQVL